MGLCGNPPKRKNGKKRKKYNPHQSKHASLPRVPFGLVSIYSYEVTDTRKFIYQTDHTCIIFGSF